MKILITGAGGMLGTDLSSRLSSKHEVLGVGRKPAPHLRIPFQAADVSRPETVINLFRSFKPEMVLHAAAMTDVDRCEVERKEALCGNFDATRLVTEAVNQTRGLLIFFSTDYVFDGTKTGPYVETDIPHPVNIYGETKLLAERYLLIRARRFLILRTSWTFGKHGNNFPKKILKQAETGKTIEVLSDQIGSPTFTGDLARAVTEMIEIMSRNEKKIENQVLHVANEGQVSRYEFARTLLKRRGFPVRLVKPATGEQVKRPARRPKNSTMSTAKLNETWGIRLRSWDEALQSFLQEEEAEVNAKRAA